VSIPPYGFPFLRTEIYWDFNVPPVPPNILDIESTPSSVAVRENQNINMTCRADGFPAPKIIWRREDGEEIAVEKKKKGRCDEGKGLI